MDEKDFIRKNGRTLYAFNCDHCGTKGYRRKLYLQKYKKNYCGNKCKNADAVTSQIVNCETCGKEVSKTPYELKNNAHHYCNSSCAAISTNKKAKADKLHPNYIDGRSSYRSRALEHYEHKCHNPDCVVSSVVELMPIEMLDVDHIDNDRSNNELDNLVLLCVWCHTLKTRHCEVKEITDLKELVKMAKEK